MSRIKRTTLSICLFISATLWTGACTEDRTRRCSEAYDHLKALASRPTNPVERARYVGACREAWDAKHVECLLRAKTRAQALECPRQRARPG